MSEQKSELLTVLEQLERDRGINRQEIIQVIEDTLVSAYRKQVGRDAIVEVHLDPASAQFSAFVAKKVVEVISNPDQEITREEAQKISSGKKYQVGDTLRVPLDVENFSRIAAQTARQIIIQKIRESERENIADEFTKKVGQIISGVIFRYQQKDILVNLGRAEGILPYREQVFREHLSVGEHIKVLVCQVERSGKSPRIILSRVRPEFVQKLLEQEVPEIYEKLVEIVKIVRAPGVRTKISVVTHNPKVDPVGACVGVKGARVKPIIEEMRNEKIDLIPYSSDPAKYIAAAFSPARVQNVTIISEKDRQAEVVVSDDMLAIAIGKNGHNINLVCELTGYNINVYSESEKKKILAARAEKVEGELAQLAGVGDRTSELLRKAGWDSVAKIAQAKTSELTSIAGIGDKTAQKIINSAKKIINDDKNKNKDEQKEK